MIVSDQIYGETELDDSLVSLIAHPALQRLTKIHQNGAVFLVNKTVETTRFEHSLGVMILLKRLGASMQEQVAGLVHDISHLAFSHTSDIVFGNARQDEHEQRFSAVVNYSGILSELQRFGLSSRMLRSLDSFSLLEQPLPELCADRIDYCLRDLLKNKLISRDDISSVLGSLAVENGTIVCKDVESGLKLGRLFFRLNRDVFFRREYESANLLLAELVVQGLEEGILTKADLHQTDDIVLSKIAKSRLGGTLRRLSQGLILQPVENGRYVARRKHRIVDPRILGTGKRLSELSVDFFQELETYKKETKEKQRYDLVAVTRMT